MSKSKKHKKSKAPKKKKVRKQATKRTLDILNKAREESVPASFFSGEIDYYWDIIDEADEDFLIHHPDNELNYRNNIEIFCRSSLRTDSVELLENLYKKAKDVGSRRILAKKIHLLRRAYLQSFKEYSANALILLTQREKVFDKWEGIYILGCYGRKNAINYLNDLLTKEKNKLLIHTIERAIQKIDLNSKKKITERGF